MIPSGPSPSPTGSAVQEGDLSEEVAAAKDRHALAPDRDLGLAVNDHEEATPGRPPWRSRSRGMVDLLHHPRDRREVHFQHAEKEAPASAIRSRRCFQPWAAPSIPTPEASTSDSGSGLVGDAASARCPSVMTVSSPQPALPMTSGMDLPRSRTAARRASSGASPPTKRRRRPAPHRRLGMVGPREDGRTAEYFVYLNIGRCTRSRTRVVSAVRRTHDADHGIGVRSALPVRRGASCSLHPQA